jgi:single-strand DNA-binding protein
MALSLNHVTLAGRLTRDPELRQIPGGDQSVAAFGIAINRRWKDKTSGEPKEEVTFLECETWGRTAQLVAQYLHKGSACYLEGRLKLDQWQDPQGQSRSKVKVIVNTVQFLDSKPQDGDAEGDDEDPAAAAPARPARATAGPRSGASAPRSRPAAATLADGEEPPF